MVKKGMNGSVDLLAKAMRQVLKEAVEEGTAPLRKDVADLKSDMDARFENTAEERRQLWSDMENGFAELRPPKQEGPRCRPEQWKAGGVVMLKSGGPDMTVGDHDPPDHYRVNALMDDFVNEVDRYWNDLDEVSLAAYVLWRLNWIHPFINGNGRTARAACYFVLCVKLGGWLPGTVILPELLRRPENRDRYVQALRHADSTEWNGDMHDFLSPMTLLLLELLQEQQSSI